MQRRAGLHQTQLRRLGGAPTSTTTAALTTRIFEGETLQLAQLLMPNVGFNRVIGSDFTPTTEVALSGANPPTINPFFNGGVLQFSGAGTSQVSLNPVTSSTYGPIVGNQFRNRATPFFYRGKFLINASQFTPGKELVLLSFDASGVGGAGASHQIQLVGIGSADPTQIQIRVGGGTQVVGPFNFSTGADGVLAGDGSFVPMNQWFMAALFFDLINVRWAFGDYYRPTPSNQASGSPGAAQGNFLDATSGQMDAVPQDAAYATCNSSAINDLTIGPNFICDALAFAYAADTANFTGATNL